MRDGKEEGRGRDVKRIGGLHPPLPQRFNPVVASAKT